LPSAADRAATLPTACRQAPAAACLACGASVTVFVS